MKCENKTHAYYVKVWAKLKSDPPRYAAYKAADKAKRERLMADPARREEAARKGRERRRERLKDPLYRVKQAAYHRRKWQAIAKSPQKKREFYNRHRASVLKRRQMIANEIDTPALRRAIRTEGTKACIARIPLLCSVVCGIIRKRMLAGLRLPRGRWAYIPNTNKMFCISTSGKVMSCSRRAAWELTPTFLRKGYTVFGCTVSRPHNPRVVTILGVHQTLLSAFGRPRPTQFHVACHKDDNRRNNKLSNLYWGTSRDNALDTIKNNKNPNHIPTPLVRKIYKSSGTTKGIAARFKVSPLRVSNIRSGRSYAEFTRGLKQGPTITRTGAVRFPGYKYKLTDKQVSEIRKLAGVESFATIARKMGVSATLVYAAATGRDYAWVKTKTWKVKRWGHHHTNLPKPVDPSPIRRGQLYDPKHKDPLPVQSVSNSGDQA